MLKIKIRIFVVVVVMLVYQYACAGTLGHYYPGVMGLRDIILPPKGFYIISYNPVYYSNDYRNKNGDGVGNYSTTVSDFNIPGSQVPVTFSGGASADIDLAMSFQMQEFLLLWTPGWKFLGADYGMMIVPSMGHVSVNIQVQASANGTIKIGETTKTVALGETFKVKSQVFGFSDLLVQPLMLDWRGKRHDFGINYGFFIPTGDYSQNRIANVGMGFWTQQLQMFGAYYFNENRSTATVFTATYNLNSKMRGKNLTPGQSLALEYGISQYLSPRLEVALTGYNQFQISSDTGSAAKNKNVWYQINGVGGQVTGWLIKERLGVTAKCSYEYYGVDRFRGLLGTANFILVF